MKTIEKRWKLILISLLVAGVIGTLGVGMGIQSSAGSQFLQGSWFDMLTVSGFPSFPMFCTYFPDLVGVGVKGTAICTFNPIKIPGPDGTLILGGTGHGVWTKTGKREFEVLFSFFITDESGQIIGTSKVRGTKKLNKAMDEYTGEGTDEMVDFKGNVIASSKWTVEGKRMSVEPSE